MRHQFSISNSLELSLEVITRVRPLAWGLAYSDKYISTGNESVIVSTNDYRDPNSRSGKWTCVHRESEVRIKTELDVCSVCGVEFREVWFQNYQGIS